MCETADAKRGKQPLLQHLKQPMPEQQVAALTDKQNREQERPKLLSENHQGFLPP